MHIMDLPFPLQAPLPPPLAPITIDLRTYLAQPTYFSLSRLEFGTGDKL